MQIILNVFRRKPLEEVLPLARADGRRDHRARAAGVGPAVGKYDEHTQFADDDHRSYNRGGEAFDVGETFAGVPFEVGVAAAREVAALTPAGATTAQLALRWIIDQPGVSVVIPGARSAAQARRERGGRGAAARRRGDARRAARGLRRADPPARARPLVGARSVLVALRTRWP